jgi:HEPN domain-containing protein
VADLISEADEFMDEAEERILHQFSEAYPLMQQAIENLFKAFLIAGGQKLKGISGLGAGSAGNVEVLFARCRSVAPEFETIEEIMGYFITAPANPDPELISDAANEIWDFVIGLLSEEDEEGADNAEDS